MNTETIDTTVKVNMFNVTAAIAEKTFNEMLDKFPELNMPKRVITDRDTGETSLKDQNLPAFAGALSLIFANKGTSDPWLATALTKVLNIKVGPEIAKKINLFLMEESLVERKSIKRTTVDRQGFERTDRIWPLTEATMVLVRKAIENPPVKYSPENHAYAVKGKAVVNGKSEQSDESMEAIYKLNSVALVLHKDSLAITDEYIFAIDAKSEEELESKMMEAQALINLFDTNKVKPFFLTHTQDFRGRIYSRGGFISTQGSKLMKACLRFAEPRPVVLHELAIYLGRLKGCKGTFEEAYQIGKVEQLTKKMLNNDINLSILSAEAESVLRDPERAIIRLDGCSNGIQWMSAFLDDEVGMELTNLSGNNVNDLYTVIMNRLGLDTRNEAKNLVMPYSYGASVRSLTKSLNSERVDMFSEDEVKEMLNDINSILPIGKYLWHLKKNLMMSKATAFSWVMPDGFKVVQEYKAHTKVGVGSLTKMKVYSTEQSDTLKMKNALPPNIIHSIDAYHARLVAKACKFPIISIHDSFGCHSENVQELRKIIRETFQKVVREDTLNLILCQLKLGDEENARSFRLLGKPVSPELITNSYMFM